MSKVSKVSLALFSVMILGINLFASESKNGSAENLKANRLLIFNSAQIEGYNSYHSPAVVLGNQVFDEFCYIPNRSFSEALKVNIDRESIERIVN
ncbi:hypothetical protein CHISP_2544 [Chitinispirillum alkaliphilum]|nr:hypothetical protein CHISP_2544 [Chitinispirillum alkaliphilum]